MTAAERTGPIAIDGVIDETAWEIAPVGTGFVQRDPVEGAPADQATEVRVLFDELAVYVAARMHDDEALTIADQLVRRDDQGRAARAGGLDHLGP